MYIFVQDQKMILDSSYVKRFSIIDDLDYSLLVAVYQQDRPPLVIGRYTRDEAREVLQDLFEALLDGHAACCLPDSLLQQKHIAKKDARKKRKGGG